MTYIVLKAPLNSNQPTNQEFRNPTWSKFGLPITLASRFYNSLYYRTSRD